MARSATSGPQGQAAAPQEPDRREEQHRGRTGGGRFANKLRPPGISEEVDMKPVAEAEAVVEA